MGKYGDRGGGVCEVFALSRSTCCPAAGPLAMNVSQKFVTAKIASAPCADSSSALEWEAWEGDILGRRLQALNITTVSSDNFNTLCSELLRRVTTSISGNSSDLIFQAIQESRDDGTSLDPCRSNHNCEFRHGSLGFPRNFVGC